MDSIEQMFKIVRQGLFREVRLPQYGKQDVGIGPRGCSDQFAFETGKLLLDNPADSPAMEIIYAPELCFSKAAFFTLTGAKHEKVTLRNSHDNGNGHVQAINHAEVYFAHAGSVLSFEKKEYGFRTYLCWREANNVPSGVDLPGRKRGDYNSIARWPDQEGKIRVIAGPEYHSLTNPEVFTSQCWKIANDSNEMGVRLIHTVTPLGQEMGNMISGPVSNGTVQLSPKGPIVLLKHRQTIGGYPRVFNVIDADVDLLAQYDLSQLVRFRMVTIEEAQATARQKRENLRALAQRFSGVT